MTLVSKDWGVSDVVEKNTLRQGKFRAFPVSHSENKNKYYKVIIINIIKLPHSPQTSEMQ